MKKSFQTLLLSFFMLHVCAQENTKQSNSDTATLQFPICLHFQSVCCGVPDEQKLKIWVNTFKKKYGIRRMSAVHVGPLGREGEYDLYFPLKGMKKNTALNFKKGIIKQAKKLNDPGMVTVEENATLNKRTLPTMAVIESMWY